MEPIETSPGFRRSLESALRRRGVRATSQAKNAMIEAIARSNWEYLADSDSVLVGLLYSGSYTIDILEDAGTDISSLRELTEWSVSGHIRSPEEFDVIEQFLSGLDSNFDLLNEKRGKKELLETADLLRAAASPAFRDFYYEPFPLHLRSGPPPSTTLQRDLELSVCNMLDDLMSRLKFSKASEYRLTRRKVSLGANLLKESDSEHNPSGYLA